MEQILLSFIVILFFNLKIYGQDQFRIVTIDSLENYYCIKIQKVDTKKTTLIYSSMNKYYRGNEIIKVGGIYKFSFVYKYKISKPELRYDSSMRETVATQQTTFKKNKKNKTYSAEELEGMYYVNDLR
ncbi:hypothetical protein [Flavobacterium suzhouense]|uniref:Uncharacterized protein n=1 Tax=Flavobacterium suzhouense TaxID=1529638 RepID=A0ABW5NR81_9FLAO